MIIVIEGVDGTGKSTLARELGDRLLMPVYKEVATPLTTGKSVEASQAEDATALALAIQTNANVIFDRFFPSEFAYGHAYNRSINMPLLAAADKALAEVDHLCVQLYFRNADDFASRIVDKEVEPKYWRKLNDGFRRWRVLSKCRWLDINAMHDPRHIIELVMKEIIARRPSKDEVYMAMAHEAARRATCLSRRTGAVLLSADGHVIASGYNGSPAGFPHQTECERLRMQAGSGAALDVCTDVHAEENVVINAALNGSNTRGGTLYSIHSPCHRCARMLINARIREVVYERLYGDPRALDMFDRAGIIMRQIKEEK